MDLSFFSTFFLQFLFCGSCMYLLMCVDPNSQGLLGKAHRFIYKLIPSLYRKQKDQDSKPNIFFRILDSIINYICYTNHPLVQYFYILIAVGGFILYWVVGFYRHFPNSMVSDLHKFTGSALALACFYVYYLACKTSPGKITKQTAKSYINKYMDYYDDILYKKQNKCTSCDFVKPARSKHCRTCDICVSKFDHHCVWIRQCVGEQNYKYFILFIFSHCVLTIYGGILGVVCLIGLVNDQRLMHMKFRIPQTDVIVDADWQIVCKETMFIFITLLCSIMGVTLVIFLLYHLSMISKDITTNEKIKRSDIISFLEKEINDIYRLDKEKQESEEIKKKFQMYKKDLKKLKEMCNQSNLWKNLKAIFAQ